MADRQETLGKTSEPAAPEVQKPGGRGVPAGTNPPVTSETPAPAAQEQLPKESVAPEIDIEQILQRPEVAERIRRQIQSEADKRTHALRLQYEQQQREERERQEREAQAQALEGMDDEELGRYRRRELELGRAQQAWSAQQAAQVQQQILAAQRQSATTFVESYLDLVPEKQAREKIRANLQEGKYPQPEDFTRACAEARDAHLQAKVEERVRKEAQEASRKDATARLAATAVPDLASGQPVANKPVYRRPQDRISDGIARRLAEMGSSQIKE